MRSVVSSAIAGALRHERRISDLIANNLSNVQTAGFKKDAPIFHTILNETMGRYENMMADGTQTLFNQGIFRTQGTLSTWPSKERDFSRLQHLKG